MCWLEKSQIIKDKQLLKIVQLALIWRPDNIIHNMSYTYKYIV